MFWFNHKSRTSRRNHREFRKKRKKENIKKNQRDSEIRFGTFLDKVSPRSGYHFYSNHFKINSHCYATILTIFRPQGTCRDLSAMWGISLLPQNLPKGVSARLLTNMNAMPHDEWVMPHLKRLTNIVKMTQTASYESGDITQLEQSNYRKYDAFRINQDIIRNHDTYFAVSIKVLLKAVSFKKLLSGIDRLKDYYSENFKNQLYLASFDGQQYDDLHNLFRPASYQLGHNFMFTSSEFAGEYNLVTQGISDTYGDYCGVMVGDINQAAMIWNMDQFGTHAIIAADQPAVTRSTMNNPRKYFPRDCRGSALWSTKLSHMALVNGHRVVHFVLDGSPITKIGLDPAQYTIRVDMNQGMINPLEFFGPIHHTQNGQKYVKAEDELTAIPRHYNKIRLMAKQIQPDLKSYDLGKNLSEALDFFYQHEDMLVPDAEHHVSALRILGLPHSQYPTMKSFVLELQVMIDSSVIQRDLDKKHSLLRIQAAFENAMARENGTIFNKKTNGLIDGAHQEGQVIYDFSKLLDRGRGVMMAQLVNTINFAVSNLQSGDVLVIDGAEQLQSNTPKNTERLKNYVASAIKALSNKDVRVVYTYDSVEAMLKDANFNRFASADWVLTGHMSRPTVEEYENKLGHNRLPSQLEKQVTFKNDMLYYLRRGNNNILFEANPFLQPLED